jgi:hypothetical protein
MKSIMLAAIAAVAVGTVMTAHAQSVPGTVTSGVANSAYGETQSRDPSLAALLTEWHRAAFIPPSKPSQYRVYGRNGYVTSGSGYNAMVALIRSALQDDAAGREQDAAAKAAGAEGMLASSNLKQGRAMENMSFSRGLGVTAGTLRADHIQSRNGLPAYLKGYKGLFILAAGFGIIGILAE